MDAETLNGMGVSPGIVNQLRPYLSRSKAAAVDALHRLPLTISQAVADELDAAMLNHHITKIADYYDRAVGLPGRFATLPWQAQAVIVSIQYQRGVNSPAQISQHLEGFRQSGLAGRHRSSQERQAMERLSETPPSGRRTA